MRLTMWVPPLVRPQWWLSSILLPPVFPMWKLKALIIMHWSVLQTTQAPVELL
jgi:hypothetical protein